MSSLLIISLVVNIFLIVRNKTLNSEINYLKNKYLKNVSVKTIPVKTIQVKTIPVKTINRQHDKDPWLNELEQALDSEVTLDAVQFNDSVQLKVQSRPKKSSQTEQIDHNDSYFYKALQSLSGWHKSFVPFLLQNIGWFIGILCFISGSLFFVSYTEGFSKTVTIFYTILTYTLLLTWGGYHLKEKVSHAALSGMVLMAISFLLIPLNFSAAGRLLYISLGDTTALLIAILSVSIALVVLFYVSKLISGVFNRQLLTHFSPVYFLLSMVQLFIPLLDKSLSVNQNLIGVLILLAVIFALLFLALVNYLPAVIKQLIVDKHYLLLFCVGSLFYSAMLAMLHIHFASPFDLSISYYAPVLLLISALLFYIDELLNAYEDTGKLLSYLSAAAYAVSFLAIFISLDSALIRIIVMALSLLLYVRLMWLYRSLVPLYLVIILFSFLYVDIFLIDMGFHLTIAAQYLYVSLLPLNILLALLFLLLRKSEVKRQKSFLLSRHLLQFIIFSSFVSGLMSQYLIESASLSWLIAAASICSLYVVLKSNKVAAMDLLGVKRYTLYCYLLTMNGVLIILLNPLLSIESKLILLVLVSVFYSFNSIYAFAPLCASTAENQRLERSVFINSALIIQLILVVLCAAAFSVSIQISLLLFTIALNSLFLSMSLYNRGLFYIFMLFSSLSAVVLKLHVNELPSTGLLLISFVFLLFYLIHAMEKLNTSAQENLRARSIHRKMPDKLLWVYPVNDVFVAINSEKSKGDQHV